MRKQSLPGPRLSGEVDVGARLHVHTHLFRQCSQIHPVLLRYICFPPVLSLHMYILHYTCISNDLSLIYITAGMSMYNSGSESDQEPEDKKKRKSDEKKRKSDEKKHKSDEKKRSGPVLDPLDVAKAFSGTVVDQTVVPIPPPSKEHREWADKLLSDLTPRSRKDSSRKHSKSEEKRSHSDRRSSQEEYHKSSKLSHKKSSRDKEKESSLKSKGTSHSRSKSSDSPIGSKRPASQGTSHSPPPPSGRSFATGFTVPKAIRGRSRSPGKSTRRKSRRSKSRSLSPPVRRVSYKKDRSRSRSRSPPPNAQRWAP